MTYPNSPSGALPEQEADPVSSGSRDRSELGVGDKVPPEESAPEHGVYQTADHRRPGPSVTLETAPTLGDALRAARQASGKSLAELSAKTRVPVRYLEALEEGRKADLPSRPFAIGHVRSYAQTLGLDETAAAERLRREYDLPSQKLESPVGLAYDEPRGRSPIWGIAAATVVMAVVGWNVFQRVSLIDAPTAADLISVPESWRVGDTFGAVELDAPRPAPPDQTTPVLYVTPGLEEVLAPALAQPRGLPRLRAIMRHWFDWGSCNEGSCVLSASVSAFDDRPQRVAVVQGDSNPVAPAGPDGHFGGRKCP